MSILKGFVFVFLAATVATVAAETRCPGNVASLPLHIVNHQEIVLDVFINHSGPYSFLLDTGSQITVVDLSLAAELHLTTQGSANLISAAGTHTLSSYAQIDLLEAGSHAVTKNIVLVHDFQKINSAIRPIRGILGEDFLGRFDMLIDNEHRMLCLDDSGVLRDHVRGPHAALFSSTQSSDSQPAPSQLVVTARVSGAERPFHLVLDSASDIAVLYSIDQLMARDLFSDQSRQEVGVDGAQRAFSILPPLEMIIGTLDLPRVVFVAPQRAGANANMAEDGVLPTGLFRRVFIDHSSHYAVLDQW